MTQRQREMAIAQMTQTWADLVASGEWTAEDMAESLQDQLDGYTDMACEEMTEEMADLLGIDIEEFADSDEAQDEWTCIVNEACEAYLSR